MTKLNSETKMTKSIRQKMTISNLQWAKADESGRKRAKALSWIASTSSARLTATDPPPSTAPINPAAPGASSLVYLAKGQAE